MSSSPSCSKPGREPKLANKTRAVAIRDPAAIAIALIADIADILERVLDKGVVIAGDISVAVGGVDLLSIRIRLIIASVERAQAMGIDWWRSDPTLSSQKSQNLPELQLEQQRTLQLEQQQRSLQLEQSSLQLELENTRLRVELQRLKLELRNKEQ